MRFRRTVKLARLVTRSMGRLLLGLAGFGPGIADGAAAGAAEARPNILLVVT
ncbi:MAG: hypothetical protein JNL92_07295, partial [Opitutaceae bacterium]|nr:hypothetical protein [Opitutaceae bacterium]